MTTQKKVMQALGFTYLSFCVVFVLFVLSVIICDITRQGYKVLSWQFITQMPRNGMTEGGIWPAIVGTMLVTAITAILSVPLGMGCAIYLNEYARDNLLTRLIRMSIRNLSGVPSIVYGLFGVVLFVQMLKIGTCVLSAGSTLGLMTLPFSSFLPIGMIEPLIFFLQLMSQI